MFDIEEDKKSLERTLRSELRLVTSRMSEVRHALERAEKFMPDFIEMLVRNDDNSAPWIGA